MTLLNSLFLLVLCGPNRSELAREKRKVAALTLTASVIVNDHRGGAAIRQARSYSYTPQRGM